MHIPDGYLSPSTCAALYTASTPFWYVALRKVKHQLHTRLIPRLALFAAFSFVLMMFNVPLPGGTSGHATGVGLAAVVLGPWAGMIAVSTALLIQALFFGDGGVSAFGANAFNMAIVGCLVAAGVYRVLLAAFRNRSWAQPASAAIASYIAINISALLTAVEFGIQPALFKDHFGQPLYAPFPLSVAVPAMLLGHLTIAGLAEAAITSGVVSYLRRTSPALLGLPQAAALRLKPIIAVLAVLVILTPVGLLTVNPAWGEWSVKDFANSSTRARIEKASGGVSAPDQAPSGMRRLESLWTAPFQGYSPALVHNAPAAYIISALTGVALLTAIIFSFGALMSRRNRA